MTTRPNFCLHPLLQDWAQGWMQGPVFCRATLHHRPEYHRHRAALIFWRRQAALN